MSIGFLQAQDKYWLPKNAMPDSVKPLFCSEWLGQCSYRLTRSQVINLSDESPVPTPVSVYETTSGFPDKEKYGFALEQINAKVLIDQGLTGKGVKIGIIDGGFLDANEWGSLSHFFENGQVAYYRDFITPKMEPYTGSMGLDDIHGTEVWQLIGGWDRDKDIRFGLATDATYYLARTDHGAYEKRMEEDLLIEAMEAMYDMGVRLINLSLGYGKGYLNPRENYTPEQMDGKTSMLARAVDTAYFKKNMLVVVAAGNEARDPLWKYLVTPGDAKGAFTVGATKHNIWEKMDYSSTGTPGLDYMKPNISCFATQGTSFSTPIITGLAAAIWQYDSTFSAQDVRQIIEESGNYFPYGNDYVGFGVPQCQSILSALKDIPATNDIQTITARKSTTIVHPGLERNYVVVLNKENSFHVLNSEVLRPDSNRIRIRRNGDARQSTVLVDNKVYEIFWKD